MSTLSSIRALLIDLSGTIHVENEVIPGAIQAVQKLREHRIPFLFVTNTTKESHRKLLLRLTSLGVPVESKEVFSSLSAAKKLIQSQQLRPMLILDDDAMEDFSEVDVTNPNAVVVGLAPAKFNYETLSEAFRLLKNGAPLIAIHKARYLKRADGLALGPGCFVNGLEYSSGQSAQVVGKPEKSFFESALDHLKLRNPANYHITPSTTVMIGDDVRDDVIGAQLAGFQGCLVQTGKYCLGDERKGGEVPVDHLFESFPAFVNKYIGAL